MAKNPFKRSMKNIYQNFVNYSFISAIVTIILGMLLLFLTDLTTKVIGIVAGLCFIGSGISSLYDYLKRDGAKLFALSIFFAIGYIALGALLIIYPYSAMNFVTICLGIFMLLKGLLKINYGLWFKKGNEDCWLVTLVTGILTGVIGILLMFNPFRAGFAINQIVGAFLIISGVLDFQNTFMFKKRAKEIMDIFW